MVAENKTYVQLLDEEKETVNRAIRSEYSDESRICFGAYVSKLAEQRLAEVEQDG